MKFKFKDISLYFKSDCCNKNETSVVSPTSCERAPQLTSTFLEVSKYHTYLKECCAINCTMIKTTITIGTQWLGKLSADDQYIQFVKQIKKHIPYHSKVKYIYHFEYMKNGQLHAHGLEIGSYQQRFHDSFVSFGKRNLNAHSYVEVKNKNGIAEYLNYINKENAYPWITNIHKKDIIMSHTKTPLEK